MMPDIINHVMVAVTKLLNETGNKVTEKLVTEGFIK